MEQKFTIIIEETVSEKFEVTAKDYEEALKKAEENYKTGKFVLEPGEVQFKKMAIASPDKDITAWVEF